MSQSRVRTVFVPAGHGGAMSPAPASSCRSSTSRAPRSPTSWPSSGPILARRCRPIRRDRRCGASRSGSVRLVNQDREPVLEIVRDDVGVHDLLFCACSPALYRQRFGLTATGAAA